MAKNKKISQKNINKDIFAKNLEAINSRDPLLAMHLRELNPNIEFEVFLSDDPINFNIIRKSDQKPMFKGVPLDELMAKLKEFSVFSHYPYLYFFGAGNGVFYKLLLDNELLKRVIVIEPNLEVLFIIFNLLDFSEDIKKDRIIFLEKDRCDYMMIDSLFSQNKEPKIYGKLYDLHVFNEFYEEYSDSFIALNKYFINAIEHSVVSVGNDTKDAIIGITNHIANLPDVIKTPSLIELVDKIKHQHSGASGTAILVATGPSLSKQIPLLREIQDFVSIICIDASLPILIKEGIKPDVVLSLERVPLSAKFYEEVSEQDKKGIIFAITSLVDKRLKDALKDQCISYSFRPFGYTTHFGIKEYGYLGIGMSAANMAYELIVHSRFKRLIIIGQDLAFGKDGSSHAKNAVYGEKEITPKTDKSEKIYIKAWGGDGVHDMVETTRVWKLFKEFYERDIALTPYKLDVINATEGGARIEGTREISFKDAAKLIDKSAKKEKIILSYPTKEQYAKNKKQIEAKLSEMIKYGEEKKAEVEAVFLKIMDATTDLESKNKNNDLENIDFDALEKLAKEIDEVKKLLVEKDFFNCFNDAIQSYIFHQEMDIAKIVVRKPKDDMDAKGKLIELIYAHKYWLFSLAGGMDCVINIAKNAKEEWQKIESK